MQQSFVRINNGHGWSTNKLDEVAAHVQRMQETGRGVYLTTWSPRDTRTSAERGDYARLIADHLEYSIRQKGLTNIHYYCVAKELTLKGWCQFAQDLPRFEAYHQAFFDEFKVRRLEVGLLATDASPESWWWTIEWAATNMDRITAISGGHHYKVVAVDQSDRSSRAP